MRSPATTSNRPEARNDNYNQPNYRKNAGNEPGYRTQCADSRCLTSVSSFRVGVFAVHRITTSKN